MHIFRSQRTIQNHQSTQSWCRMCLRTVVQICQSIQSRPNECPTRAI